MRKALPILFLVLAGVSAPAQAVQSPGGKLALVFALSAEGEPTYQFTFSGRPVVKTSRATADDWKKWKPYQD